MKLIDSHCHLHDTEFFSEGREEVYTRAIEAGVAMFCVGTDERSSREAVEFAESHDDTWAIVGVHPHEAKGGWADIERVLRENCGSRVARGEASIIGIGEIGLDFFVPGHDASRQEQFFIEQLQIAAEFNLPVLLHVRRAVVQVLKCLRHSKVLRGIAHAFNGSRQQAQAFIDLGFKLGFGGAMTWPRATRIRQLATELPLESIVLETDAPDMSPVWRQGQRNSPDQLPLIAATLADLTRLPPGRILEQTNANALAVIESLSGGLSE